MLFVVAERSCSSSVRFHGAFGPLLEDDKLGKWSQAIFDKMGILNSRWHTSAFKLHGYANGCGLGGGY